jgi:hypothetical protein
MISESGALLLAPEPILPGLILEVENRSTREVARVRAVSCADEPDAFGFWHVGVALLSQRSGFFRVTDEEESADGHERRRSQRVALVHPVELVREKEALPGRTRVVNRHGALVLAVRSCPSGEPLWVRNFVSGRVRRARVVRSEPARAVPDCFEVVFEFEQPPRDFWGPEYDV